MPTENRIAPIRVFVESWADRDNTNAQNLSSKEIVARLDPKRFHVTMICGRDPDARIASRPNTVLLPWRRHGNTLLNFLYLVSQKPDVYFFPRVGALYSLYNPVRSRIKLPTKIVAYVVSTLSAADHEKSYFNDAQRNFYKEMRAQCRAADIVVGNSMHVSNDIHQLLGISAKAIHSGIDSSIFFANDLPTEKTTLTVLYAGSFQRRKRPDVLISEAQRWPNVRFRMVGEGEELKPCMALTEQLGCSNVTFLGHLPQAKLAEEMRNADIFLFPSRVEGHPQVLGQAAACGLPCIAMDCYHPDYVVHGETGFLCSDFDDLSKRLRELLDDSALRAKMSRAAMAHARKFDWNAVVKQWESLFERVVIS
jgi:glycosyltransferase involved in cell wall biosynthesis